MRVTLANIKTGIFASALALSAAACSNRETVDRVKKEAYPYVQEINRFDAERSASYYSASGTRPEYAEKVVYWDSIVSKHKEKEAFEAGKEYAVKKHNGDKKVQPQKYPIDFLTRDIQLDGMNILNSLRTSTVVKTTTREWLRMREAEPDIVYNGASTPSEIMFWRHITNAHKYRKAFANGVKFAKDSIANFKTNILPSAKPVETKDSAKRGGGL